MACEIPVQTETKVWGWCKKWGVPYPCRKTETKTFFQYDFTQTRYVPFWFPFREIREGCCGGLVYRWSRRVWWSTPKPSDWVFLPYSRLFSSLLEKRGACPPRTDPGGGGIE